MKNIEKFLLDVDRHWRSEDRDKIRLPIIGSSALLLQTDYDRGTKDSDVLGTDVLSGEMGKKLLLLAGKGTNLHTKHRVYLDIVVNALPFLPRPPHFHASSLSHELKHFDVQVLDIVDVAVSKLTRFNANDAGDVRAMAEMGLIKHKVLIERFRKAVDGYEMDARADDLPNYIRNLHTVERDFLRVPETKIDLPGWLEERF